MPSKRNKLLIFLGLITVAVSKSHNQRFRNEHEFESTRTSASKPSANSRQIDAVREDDVVPLWPTKSETATSRQFYKRFGSVHEESGDHSSNIDPKDFYFEPQKVKGRKSQGSSGVSTERFFTRRTGILIEDTQKPNTGPKIEKPVINTAPINSTLTEDGGVQKTSTKSSSDKTESEIPGDKKEAIKKKKSKRKKVLRVRPRTQNNNKTRVNNDKSVSKVSDKVKLVDHSTTKVTNEKESKHHHATPKLTDQKRPKHHDTSKTLVQQREPKHHDTSKTLVQQREPKHHNTSKTLVQQREPKHHDTSKTLVQQREPKHHQATSKLTDQTRPKNHDTSTKLAHQKESKRHHDTPKLFDLKRPKHHDTSTKLVNQKGPKLHHTIPKLPDQTKPNHPVVIKHPKPKHSDVNSDESKNPKIKIPEFLPQKEVSTSKKNGDVAKKRNVKQNNETIADGKGENEQVETFFRRTGQKVVTNVGAQQRYPEADWVSKYKSENKNKDDSFYVLSFNYMGNKQDPTKESLQLRQISSQPRNIPENLQEDLKIKISPKETGEHPTEELNIRHLEEVAGKFIQRQNHNLVKSNAAHQSGFYHPEEDIPTSSLDSDFYRERPDISDDLSINDKSFPEKQHSPKVTLKRKKTKNHKQPVWTLEKKIPINSWKQDKTTDEHESPNNHDDTFRNPDDTFRNHDDTLRNHDDTFRNHDDRFKNHDTFKNPDVTFQIPDVTFKNQDVTFKNHDVTFKNPDVKFKKQDSTGVLKPTSNGEPNYYVRSFIKLPTGDKVDINLKENFPRSEFKEVNVKRKPLLPLQNKPDGNYFMHVYKKMGNAENFEIENGRNPDKGYLSSIKLSWTDDDTRARVVESLDSRSFIPIAHSYSAESIISAEDTRRDVMLTQPSENLMQYKAHYIEDFMHPLTSDKSYFYHDVPFMSRRKRSADKTPRVTTHFRLGETNVENNFTLEHKPRSRFFFQRISVPVNKAVPQVKPTASPTTDPQHTNGQPRAPANKPTVKNVESYYHKPVESRGVKEMKSELNIPDVFDKYEKPSREVQNIHIFHSYQTPNRNPKHAHDMTYFHNDKNRQTSIKITDTASTHKMLTPQPNSNRNSARNVPSLKNFKMTTGVGAAQSSTDIQASYLKPGKETASKVLKQTTMEDTSSPNQMQPQKEIPVIQARNDEETGDKITVKTTIRPATTRVRTKVRKAKISLRTTTRPTTTSFRTTKRPSTTSVRTTIKPSPTSESTTIKPSTTSESTTIKPSTTSESTTIKSSTKSESITIKPTTTSMRTTVKPDIPSVQTTIEPAITSMRTTIKPSTTSTRTTVGPATTPVRTTSKQSTTFVSTTVRPATTYVTVRTTLKLTKLIKTTTKPEKSSVTNRGQRIFRKNEGRSQTKHVSQAASYVQARRNQANHEAQASSNIQTRRNQANQKAQATSGIQTRRNQANQKAHATSDVQIRRNQENQKDQAAPDVQTKRNQANQKAHATSDIQIRRNQANQKDQAAPDVQTRRNQGNQKAQATSDVRTRQNQENQESQAAFNVQARRNQANKESQSISDAQAGRNQVNHVPQEISNMQARQNQANQVPQPTSNVQARRIDDKDWLYPQEYSEGENGNPQVEDISYLEKKPYEKKRITENNNFHPQQNENFQKGSIGAIHQMSFKFRDPLTHQPSEPEHPTYHSIPKTSFTCKGRTRGYYADPETGCQVFHMCQGTGVKHSFLCPNTTIFNQRLLVCDFYTKSLCETSESFYEVNNHLYQVPPKPAKYYVPRSKKIWKSQKKDNQNTLSTRYSRPTNENYKQNSYQAAQTDKPVDKEVKDMPLFIVKHFKENIPNARFEKPKGVSKSYSAVISEPKPATNSPSNDKPGGHYRNEKPLSYVEPPNTREKLNPDAFADNQKTLKNSWNSKDMQKTMKHELLRVPEQNHPFHQKPLHYLRPVHEKSRVTHTPEKTIIITPLVNENYDNSYYVPNTEDEIKFHRNENAHIAGRQNEKVIVVNRNRLNPTYDSSESQESTESGTAALQENSKHARPVQRYNDSPKDNIFDHKTTTQKHSTHQNRDAYHRSKDGYDNTSPRYNYNIDSDTREQKPAHFEARAPHYTHPVAYKTQNGNGSREFNYVHRPEDPNDLEKTQPSKISMPKSNQNVHIKSDTDSKEDDPQKAKIKMRIAEIKSGVESIGAQVGKILGGGDNAFKNVRIFKLKPDGSKGELEEIRLKPFKFERQPHALGNSKPKDKRREEVEIKLVKNDPRYYEKLDTKFKPDKQMKTINNEKRPETHSVFQMNTRTNYGNNMDQNAYLAIPKPVQKVVEDVAPKYKNFPEFKPNKVSYKESTGQMKSHNQEQAVPNNIRNNIPNINKRPNTDTLIKDLRINNHKNVPRTMERPVDHNIQMRIPQSKTTLKETPDKSYEIKYIPIIKVDTKSNSQNKQITSFPAYKNEKPERFENAFLPKNTEGRGSGYMHPEQINFQGDKDEFIDKKPYYLDPPKSMDSGVLPNGKYNFDSFQAINNDNLNQKFPDTKLSGMQHNYEQNMFHKTTTAPRNQKKEVRTFVVLSKPVTTTERYSNIQPNIASNTYHYNNFKTTEIPSSIKPNNYQYNLKTTKIPIQPTVSQNLHQQRGSGCEDSASNPNSFNVVSLELGKNGPPKHILNVDRGTGDISVYYKLQDESMSSPSKCRDNSDSTGQNQVPESKAALSNANFFNKPVPKISFKDLKRPENAYAPAKALARFNSKDTDETMQLKSKPVKLFDMPRNSRPAFTKPATAIPLAVPESRNNYSPQMGREIKPVRIFQNERPIRPAGHFRGQKRQQRPSYFQDQRKQISPIGHSQNNKRPVRPLDYIPDDSRSMDRSKRVVHGKNSRYADLEKAAELKALQMSRENEQKSKVQKFPAVRTKPQGKIVHSQGNSRESSEKSDSSHSRHSRYAAIEKAAELKAMRMLKSKNKSQ